METLDFTLPNVEKGAWDDFVIVTFPVKFICSIVAKTVSRPIKFSEFFTPQHKDQNRSTPKIQYWSDSTKNCCLHLQLQADAKLALSSRVESKKKNKPAFHFKQ